MERVANYLQEGSTHHDARSDKRESNETGGFLCRAACGDRIADQAQPFRRFPIAFHIVDILS